MAVCGHSVPEEEHVLSIFAGLTLEFEPSIAVLTSKMIPKTLGLSMLYFLHKKTEPQQFALSVSSTSAYVAMRSKKSCYGNQSAHRSGHVPMGKTIIVVVVGAEDVSSIINL